LSKNVAVFVDVANIFYAAKAAGVDIDYVTLLKASSAGRDLVRAYAYTGLDPDNENQRNFHDFLRRHGYKVVSKDIRKYGDGKVKANLDIELVVDMMKTARNLDIAIVVSGDGDFAPAIRAVQEMGVRVEVVSFRGNTSSDLIEVADIFTDITQIAKVEKGSSRSGRRVADDEEDLSMTEVPEKQSEGTGDGRRRGRGRARSGETATARTATPRAAASRAGSSRSRTSSEAAAREDAAEVVVVALPGEKLSRAARPAASKEEPQAAEAGDAAEPRGLEDELAPRPLGADGEAEGEEADANGLSADDSHRRRRRRRGGRGRGRGGASRREGEVVAADGAPLGGELDEVEEPEPAPAPRRPAFSFGSVWDSQLGKTPAATSAASSAGITDEEDLEEPAIPEYLLAERRRGAGGGSRRPGRGGPASRRGGAYAAALDRERFGGGRGSVQSRFAEPTQRHRGIGAGHEAGGRGSAGRGYERSEARGSGGEPWSEVPPEIEAMLRAQMTGPGRAARPAPGRERGTQAAESERSRVEPRAARPTAAAEATAAPSDAIPASAEAGAGTPPARARRAAAPRRTASTKAPAAAGASDEASDGKPARSVRRSPKAPTAAGEGTAGPAEAGSAAPTRARRSKPAAGAPEAPSSDATEAPKRRPARRKSTPAG
jgi:uncharacterized LabA/DUF88 family protein